MTEDEARDQLRRMVASDTFPTIDGQELTDLLRLARRPDWRGILDVDVPLPDGATRTAAEGQYAIWQPSHAYTAGQTVVPIRRNGHVYTVAIAGTSGTEPPLFPTSGTVTDGTVTWTETNTAVVWQPTYNLNSAAAEGWRWKAGRTADRISFGTQGDNYNAEQMHQHCVDMAKYYEGRVFQSVKVTSARTKPLDMARLPRAN